MRLREAGLHAAAHGALALVVFALYWPSMRGAGFTYDDKVRGRGRECPRGCEASPRSQRRRCPARPGT